MTSASVEAWSSGVCFCANTELDTTSSTALHELHLSTFAVCQLSMPRRLSEIGDVVLSDRKR